MRDEPILRIVRKKTDAKATSGARKPLPHRTPPCAPHHACATSCSPTRSAHPGDILYADRFRSSGFPTTLHVYPLSRGGSTGTQRLVEEAWRR